LKRTILSNVSLRDDEREGKRGNHRIRYIEERETKVKRKRGRERETKERERGKRFDDFNAGAKIERNVWKRKRDSARF
jgi:hypothetical protein